MKFFNYKRVAGLIAVGVGGCLMAYAMQSMQKITQAKQGLAALGDFFTKDPIWNPLVTFFGAKARESVSQHDLPVMLCLIGGIVLVVFGAVVFIMGKSRTRHPL